MAVAGIDAISKSLADFGRLDPPVDGYALSVHASLRLAKAIRRNKRQIVNLELVIKIKIDDSNQSVRPLTIQTFVLIGRTYLRGFVCAQHWPSIAQVVVRTQHWQRGSPLAPQKLILAILS